MSWQEDSSKKVVGSNRGEGKCFFLLKLSKNTSAICAKSCGFKYLIFIVKYLFKSTSTIIILLLWNWHIMKE